MCWKINGVQLVHRRVQYFWCSSLFGWRRFLHRIRIFPGVLPAAKTSAIAARTDFVVKIPARTLLEAGSTARRTFFFACFALSFATFWG